MPAAQGVRTQLLAKLQSAEGVVATGNFDRQRFAPPMTLNLVKQTVEGQEIRTDRNVQDHRHGNRNWQGDVNVELCYADHELLISSAMFSAWGTDYVEIGTTPQWLSLEDGALDIAQYRMFYDGLVNTATFRFAPNAMVTATFGFVGKNANAIAGSSSGGTPVQPTNNNPFDSFTAALYDETPSSGDELAIVTSLEFQIENGVAPSWVVGSQSASLLEFGQGRVTGTLVAQYRDATFLNRFINETESVLNLNITDPDGNQLQFLMPRVKYNGGEAPVQNPQTRLITMPFIALRDPTLLTALRITKTPA